MSNSSMRHQNPDLYLDDTGHFLQGALCTIAAPARADAQTCLQIFQPTISGHPGAGAGWAPKAWHGWRALGYVLSDTAVFGMHGPRAHGAAPWHDYAACMWVFLINRVVKNEFLLFNKN
jgi:hypothetical protein